MNVEIIWTNFLKQIYQDLNALSYKTWFENTKLYSLEDGKAIIVVPLIIHKMHLAENYLDIITEILEKLTGTTYEVEFLLQDEVEELEKEKQTEDLREDILSSGLNSPPVENNLNPKYTFDNFIVGNSNKFAHAAAVSVAQAPGKTHNPLFLYGNSGLGKTHLMHAIGNYIVENSNLKVLYVTSDQFVYDFVGINQKDENGTNFDSVNSFKNKYRNIDVLMIDDIQFLGRGTQSQQEFFHTFTSLHDNNKQIVISSDRSPKDLKLLEDRLKTRFYWGLTVDIYPPDINLRKEILKRKIKDASIDQEIPEDVIDYIASNMGNDVRQLEGSITRLVAYSTIMGKSKITLDLAIDALKDFISKGLYEKNDVHRIQRVVSEYFQISVDDIRSKKRSANIAFPRQIAMYLCRQLTDESFPKIGMEFGGKDHTTVMYCVEKIEQEIKVNKDLANIIEKLKKDIQ